MTRRLSDPAHRLARKMNNSHRAILPIRSVGNSPIISLPKTIRVPMGLKVGDRLLMEYEPETQSIRMTLDSAQARDEALKKIDNLEEIGKLVRYLKRSEKVGGMEWSERAERVLKAIYLHLKGEELERAEDDEGFDL